MDLDPDFAALASPASAPTAVPQAPAAQGGLDPDFAALAGPAEAEKTPGPNFGSWGNAATATFLRPAISAAAAVPGMAMDAGVALRNAGSVDDKYRTPSLADPYINYVRKMLGIDNTQYEMPSATLNKAIDQYLPKSQGLGKVNEFLATAALGGKLPLPNAGDATAVTAAANAPAQSALTGAQQKALQGGANIGMQATPGMQTGSTPLKQLEAWLESHPWTSGVFSKLSGNNQTVLNKAAAKSVGEDSSTLDSSVLERANERLGNTFESTRSPNRITLTNPEETKGFLDQLDNEFSGLLPGNGSLRGNPLVAQLEKLTSGGAINGQEMGSLSSKLGRAAYKQMSSPSGDRDMGQALYRVKDHVDDMVQQSLNGDEQAEFGAARQQYRNLMLLTSRTNIVNPSTGDVSGVALANKLQQSDKSGFLYGRNQSDLYNAARFAQAFKPIVGNSGTATRGWGMADLPLGIPANLAARFYLSKPGAAVGRGALQLPGLMGKSARGLTRSSVPEMGLLAPPED